jgi:hypothetical protein
MGELAGDGDGGDLRAALGAVARAGAFADRRVAGIADRVVCGLDQGPAEVWIGSSWALTLGPAASRLGRIGSREGGGWTALMIAAAFDEARAQLHVCVPVGARGVRSTCHG